MAAGALLALASLAYGAEPAFYHVCKGKVGDLRFSNRQADGSFLVRCPTGEIELEIKNCTGSVSLDTRYNALVTCRQTGKVYPVIRGAYPK